MSEPMSTLSASEMQASLKKPSVVSFLCCDWASVSKDGKVALGGVFDFVSINPSQPVITSFFLVTRFIATFDSPVTAHLYLPDGNLMSSMETSVAPGTVLASEDLNYFQIVTQVGFTFPTTGIYYFEFLYRGARIGLYPLQVKEAPSSGTANQ